MSWPLNFSYIFKLGFIGFFTLTEDNAHAVIGQYLPIDYYTSKPHEKWSYRIFSI